MIEFKQDYQDHGTLIYVYMNTSSLLHSCQKCMLFTNYENKGEKNANYRAFYIITIQHYSKASQAWKTGKTEGLSQIGKDKEDMKLNVL